MSTPVQQPFKKIINILNRIEKKQDNLESKINNIIKKVNILNVGDANDGNTNMSEVTYKDNNIRFKKFSNIFLCSGTDTSKDVNLRFTQNGQVIGSKNLHGNDDINYLVRVNTNGSQVIDKVMIKYGWVPKDIATGLYDVNFTVYLDNWGSVYAEHFFSIEQVHVTSDMLP